MKIVIFDFNDEIFWFFNFSFITQFVFVFLPGRQPLNFYLCSNLLKLSQVDDPSFKLNWQLTFLQIFSFLLHTFANVKIKLYKKKQEETVVVVISNFDKDKKDKNKKDEDRIDKNKKDKDKYKKDKDKKDKDKCKKDKDKKDKDKCKKDKDKNNDISSIDNRAISDFVTNVLSIVATSSFGITTSLVNWTSPKMFNVYPHYLIVYFMHFVVPFLITGTICLLYYIRHPPLRKIIFREIKLNFKLSVENNPCSG